MKTMKYLKVEWVKNRIKVYNFVKDKLLNNLGQIYYSTSPLKIQKGQNGQTTTNV